MMSLPASLLAPWRVHAGIGKWPVPSCLMLKLLVVGYALTSAGNLRGQAVAPLTASSSSFSSSSDSAFWANRGRWTFGLQVGYGLENATPRNISHINLLIFQPQVGLIVLDSRSPHFPVSRFEVLGEGILGNAIHPGGHLRGQALLFRFDAKPLHRVVPFFDMGAGVEETLLHQRAPELSGALQFSPQIGLGFQYFFNPQRAFVLEYRYLHMSNGGIEPPNHGFNASMLSMGFRWLRRPRPDGWRPSRPWRNPFHYLFGAE